MWEHAVALIGRQRQDGLADDLQREQAELLLQVHCTNRGSSRGAAAESEEDKAELELANYLLALAVKVSAAAPVAPAAGDAAAAGGAAAAAAAEAGGETQAGAAGQHLGQGLKASWEGTVAF